MYKIHLFETKSAHDYAYNRINHEYVEPWVAYTREDKSLSYNLPIDWEYECLTFKVLESGTFQYTKECSYSLDKGKTWITIAANTSTPTISAGNTIKFKSTNGNGRFSSTGFYEAMGNPYSMFVGEELPPYIWYNGALKYMFSGSTKLVSAENMIMPKGYGDEMCLGTFKGCTSLVTPPKTLPSTLSPNSGYCSMFEGCTSLKTVPRILATKISPYCYQNMFAGCTSLTTTPELPTTKLARECYRGMFQRCTSLTTAPELPATALTMNCYREMFSNCTALTTAPELPATTLDSSCYNSMFLGCTSLNYIKAMFTTTPSDTYTKNWVSGVASTGTFVKNSAAEWNVSGVNGIPNGWTIETASA